MTDRSVTVVQGFFSQLTSQAASRMNYNKILATVMAEVETRLMTRYVKS